MSQQTFAEAGFEPYRKLTRRERFLAEMEQVIPWSELAAVIEPHYPKAEGAGCPPVGVERMLRIHFLQHWVTLSDPAVEKVNAAPNMVGERCMLRYRLTTKDENYTRWYERQL